MLQRKDCVPPVPEKFAVWVESIDRPNHFGFVDLSLERLTLEESKVALFPTRDDAAEFVPYSMEGPLFPEEPGLVEIYAWPYEGLAALQAGRGNG